MYLNDRSGRRYHRHAISNAIVAVVVSPGYVFTLFVCLFVCLFASRITQKLLNRFSENSVEMWHTGRGKNSLDIGGNLNQVTPGFGLRHGRGYS